ELGGSTVGEVLQALEREHPGVRGWILDEHGSIREHINVFVNRDYGRVDTAVGENDRLHVLPAISGGWDDPASGGDEEGPVRARGRGRLAVRGHVPRVRRRARRVCDA